MTTVAFQRPRGALSVVSLLRCVGLLASLLLAPVAAAREYSVGPVPDWVAPVQAPVPDKDDAPTEGGVRYLLVDNQTRNAEGATERFTHYATQATNEQGVSEVATHEIDFDPSYQALVLHSLDVVRGGQRVSRLREATVRVLQREKELDNRIYDGRLSAHIFLEDIRVGDTVEIAWSVRGSNPVFAGNRFGRFDLAWGVPVERLHARLLQPVARPLALRTRNGAPEPTERVLGAEREYVWRQDDVAPLLVEDDAPGWFDPYAHATWSEFDDWNAVARWAAPLYAPARLGPALQAEVAKIRAGASTDEARLLAALRLVQGELRYLGFEMGPGSHAPRAPDTVFARRFGDCKDKALLLVSLLHALDIRAHAALVSAGRTRGIVEDLPSPGAFDHVIVHARLGDKGYWLDPTRAAQHASLDALVQPDFGHALVVDPATRALASMAPVPAKVDKRRVDVEIDATAGLDKPAHLQVTTTYLGDDAESMRARVASTSAAALAKDYLNYYARYYADLRIAKPMQVRDDAARNRLVVVEHYEIPRFWPRAEADKRFEAGIHSPEMEDRLRAPSSTTRVAPVGMADGVDFIQRTVVKLHEAWDIDEETHAVEDPQFTFERTIAKEEGGLRLVFTDHYRSRADHVPSQAVPAFAANLSEARDQLGYTLYQNDVVPPPPFLERFNWMVAMLVVLLLAAFAWAARRLYRWDPAPRADLPHPELAGINGWLILPAIGLSLSPFLILATWLPDIDVYAMPTWSSLTHPGGSAYDPVWAPLLLGELAGTLALVVGFVLVALLFFQRRRSTPIAYVALLAFNVLFNATDLAATSAVTGSVEPQGGAELAKTLVHLMVWGPYFFLSRRVRATFTRGYRDGATPAPGAGSATPPPRVPIEAAASPFAKPAPHIDPVAP